MARDIPRILEPYGALLDEGTLDRLIAVLDDPLPAALRVNPLKIEPAEAARLWRQWYGWELQPVPFCPAGWQLAEPSELLSRTVEHQMGLYYIQDAASMLPVELFDFAPGAAPLVLDMAASPGGKTTHLIGRLGDQGLVVANDSNTQRLPALQANLGRWGATGAAVTNHPGERFGAWLPEAFDAVLLDAPCSGEALRTGEKRKSRLISSHERNTLQQRQIKLLESAAQALRPGGQLVYATCSLAPEEDEAVLDALLRRYPGQLELEAAPPRLAISAPGLAGAGGQDYHPAMARALRLWPHLYDTAGFFAARLRKRDSIPAQQAAQGAPAPHRPLDKAGFKPLAAAEQGQIETALRDEFGFDLAAFLGRQGLELWKSGKLVQGLPARWLARFGELPFAAAGLPIGKLSRQGFQPAHELVSRCFAEFPGGRLRIDDGHIAAWLARRDLPRQAAPAGLDARLVLLEDSRGRFLGRAGVTDQALENLLPRWQ
ncbi:MAG TPA: NOL1/NOP2/sun family putative RNA methylase [Herpetosiphonaceae bacterium]